MTQNKTISGTDQRIDGENLDPIADIVDGTTTGKFVNYYTITMG